MLISEIDGHTFFPVMIKRDNEFYAWVFILAPEETARRFRATMTVGGDYDSKMKITLSSQVFPVDLKFEDMLKRHEDVLIFSNKQAVLCKDVGLFSQFAIEYLICKV